MDNKIIDAFEIRVFRYGLLVATGFRIFRSIHEVTTDYPLGLKLLGFVNLALLGLVYYYHKRFFRTCLLIFFVQILVTSFLTWDISGGWDGAASYILIAAILAIVMTSHDILQYSLLFLYAIALSIFSAGNSMVLFQAVGETQSLVFRQTYFVLIILILILMTRFMKMRFIRYRNGIASINKRLADSNQVLQERAAELEEQMVELNAIRSNLEQIVMAKVEEANTKANVLKEFAFVNAHHIRGPLARILGLIQLIEYERNGRPIPGKISNIKRHAMDMDDIVPDDQ